MVGGGLVGERGGGCGCGSRCGTVGVVRRPWCEDLGLFAVNASEERSWASCQTSGNWSTVQWRLYFRWRIFSLSRYLHRIITAVVSSVRVSDSKFYRLPGRLGRLNVFDDASSDLPWSFPPGSTSSRMTCSVISLGSVASSLALIVMPASFAASVAMLDRDEAYSMRSLIFEAVGHV